MSATTAFRLTQGCYWLALGVWVGAMVMLVIGAAITFQTVPRYKPTLGAEPYNDPVLAPHGVGILAGGITGNVLGGLRVLQVICAVIAAGCVVLQCTVFAGELVGGVKGGMNLLRVALVTAPMVLLAVDSLVLAPRIWSLRNTMYNPREPAERRESVRVEFRHYHVLDERCVGAAALCLMAAVLVSPFAFKTSGQPRTGPPELNAAKDSTGG